MIWTVAPIALVVTETDAGAAGVRSFAVTYWENYPQPPMLPGLRTEAITW